MSKQYDIAIWTIRFCKVNENGNELLDKNGTVRLFEAPNLDFSYILKYANHSDLVEIYNYPKNNI